MLQKMSRVISLVVLTGLLLAACQPQIQAAVTVVASTPQAIVQVVTATPSPVTDTPAPIIPTPTATPTHQEYVRQTFAYDLEAPLDIQEVSIEDRDGIKVHNIHYASLKGGQVPAYLVVPPGDGPFAGILFLHWGLGNREQFLDEALQLARRGTVSLLIDGPMNRPGYNGRLTTAMYIQTVLDLQRGVDLLTARPDVDASRIGYVGHSFGAVWGGVLAGVERRISAYVLMAGHARISKCANCGVSTTSYLHAIHYIGQAAPASVFFQFAERDEYITREAALEYYEACSEPKRIEWYDAEHQFNERARLDRIEWLSAQLGLEPRTP